MLRFAVLGFEKIGEFVANVQNAGIFPSNINYVHSLRNTRSQLEDVG